jgi:hypothetical protein
LEKKVSLFFPKEEKERKRRRGGEKILHLSFTHFLSNLLTLFHSFQVEGLYLDWDLNFEYRFSVKIFHWKKKDPLGRRRFIAMVS